MRLVLRLHQASFINVLISPIEKPKDMIPQFCSKTREMGASTRLNATNAGVHARLRSSHLTRLKG